MISHRLLVTDTTLGALTLYSHQSSALSEQGEHDGELFATHAAIALVGAQTEARLLGALVHRDVIGMAKGILMQRYRAGPVQAFRVLVDSSQHTPT